MKLGRTTAYPRSISFVWANYRAVDGEVGHILYEYTVALPMATKRDLCAPVRKGRAMCLALICAVTRLPG